MGRRKKKNTGSNIAIIIIGILLTALVACGVYIGLQYWSPGEEIVDIPDKPSVQVPPEEVKPPQPKPEPSKQEEYVNIFKSIEK